MKVVITYKSGKIEKFCNCSKIDTNDKDMILIIKKSGELKAMRFKEEIQKIDFRNGG